MEATNAPIEPFDGFVTEGGSGFGWFDRSRVGDRGDGELFSKSMLGSSAIIESSRPAQPSWLSTTLGS